MTGFSIFTGFSGNTGLWDDHTGLWGGFTGFSAFYQAALTLNFLSGAPLDSRITFTRSTTATFIGSNGLIQSSAINAPRFDYNPVTLAPLGLLIEEQRVNLLLRSEEFDNAGWTKTRASITANATTSPDGTTNADSFVINTTAATNHQVGQSASVTSGTTYALTVFAKADQFSQINLRFSAQFPTGNAFFDLNSGTVNSGGTIVSASMTSFGNGWWRCALVATANATGSSSSQIFLAQNNSITIPIADGTSGLFLYGAQLEAGAFATSYIPTVATTVTRTADIAVMTGTNFSSWYNASEGTFVSSFEASPNPYTTYVAASNGVVAQNSIHMDNDIGGTMRVPYYSGSAPSAILSLGAIGTIGAVNTIATAYRVNDFAASRNGATVVTDSAGAVPVGVVQLNIGADPSGAAVNVSNTHIRSITYYPQRLPGAQLQALST
jgi:hypothetical protein